MELDDNQLHLANCGKHWFCFRRVYQLPALLIRRAVASAIALVIAGAIAGTIAGAAAGAAAGAIAGAIADAIADAVAGTGSCEAYRHRWISEANHGYW